MASDAPSPQAALTWDEPRVIAGRLAVALGLPLREEPDGEAAVLITSAQRLGELADDELRDCAAFVVVDDASAPTSGALIALIDAVTTRGAVAALATFATVLRNEGATEVPLVVGAHPDDPRVPRLLAAGPHALTLDPAVDAGPAARDAAPARVCVVSFEIAGMTGGGIGTASTALAELLARCGHDVTLLFTGWQERDAMADNEGWREHFAERGVRLAVVRDGPTASSCPHFVVRSAHEVYRWLCEEPPFDVVHLPENLGHGVYAQGAKQQGLRFADTTFVVGTHGPTRWAAEANRVVLTREEFLVQDVFEHLSVARADVLLGPSRYLHDYLRGRGWRLPERVHVQPYPTPGAVRAANAPRAHAPASPPSELVFFGRLETRKGVATLCDALDLLATDVDDLPAFEVTFLGPIAEVLGSPADTYLAERAQQWPWPWRILADRDQQAAAAYLQRPGVLALMPSLIDNAPNTVSEAIALGIPLVASRDGGTAELIEAVQRDDHTFRGLAAATLPPVRLSEQPPDVDPRPLADLLRHRLATPTAAPRPPVDPLAVDAAYDRWHRAVRRARAAEGRTTRRTEGLPSLAVCLLFDGDEQLLAMQLAALGDSERPADELIVADLRERSAEPIATAGAHGTAVVRPHRRGHAGEARNAAVAATSAELIAFVPAGDVPLPTFLDTLRQAVAATAADVCSCAVLDARAEASHPPGGEPVALVPFPAPPVAGLERLPFAVGPYVIRREVLMRLGGFTADTRGEESDHELLNRVVAAGLLLEVVAEPLAERRRALAPAYDDEQALRVMRPLAADAGTSDLLGLLRGSRQDALRLAHELDDQHAVYERRAAEQQRWIDELEATATQLRDDRAALLPTVETLRADVGMLIADKEALLHEQQELRAELELYRSVMRVLARDCRRLVRRTLDAVRRRMRIG